MENPIPFAPSALTRTLTTAYLHVRYALLLAAPAQLSADWSYACIPYVERLTDPRNAVSLALYALLAAAVVAARPLRLAAELLAEVRGRVAYAGAEHSKEGASLKALLLQTSGTADQRRMLQG